VFFTVADAMKIAIPLGELANRGALPARRPLRVVDAGAGCGAMSLGLVATLDPAIALELHAFDRDSAALWIAAAAIRALGGERVALATRVADVSAALPPADLVVIGSVLNELPAERAVEVVRRAVAAVGDDGAVIAIEPALRDTSRALHAIRDALIADGTAHVFAPCTRRGAPCPALADPSDWCHEDRPLELPPRTAELAHLTHLRDHGMKFSYLVLRRRPLALVDEPGAWRIVSAPRPAKGKLEVIGCSEAGRIPLRLLRRNRDDANRALERAGRGDVVVVDAAPGPDRVEVGAGVRVVRHEPAERPTK
jgi:ribosomal protein RSM22 (predicted rRNA methylase)